MQLTNMLHGGTNEPMANEPITNEPNKYER
jgi:hypothetical protein